LWRLNTDKILGVKELIVKNLQNKEAGGNVETDTASYPNNCVENMIDYIQEEIEDGVKLKNIELEFVDNIGGGGNWEFVEACWEIALQYCRGKITKDEALKQEENLWDER
jgi:hypothetical protein